MSNKIDKYYFVCSFIVLSLFTTFGYGLLVGKYHYWPHDTLVLAQNAVESLLKMGTIRPEHVWARPAPDAPRDRISVYDSELVPAGYYAFMGWDERDRRYAVWLYNHAGEKVHTWTIDYFSLDPDGPSNQSDHPHGLHILSDGSLVVNFDKGDVMARLDACGQPIWIKNGAFHHLISDDEDGSLWTWRGEGTAYGQYQYIVNFDPKTGSTIKEISLVDDIIRALGPDSIVFSVRPDFNPRKFEKDPPAREDLFHPNDVEVLRSDLEQRFPDFEAGDLLLSFRNLNLVAVLDPDTNQLKWWSHGPWRDQHDPDYTADGKISVYNNNFFRGSSEIVKIDPSTREITSELVYLNFRSPWMGVHQYLPNGNLLLVSPREGRGIVLTRNGEKIFEFNNVLSDDYNGLVENGLWLPENFFESMPTCSKTH